jgi:phosphosulfolactate synthase
MSEQPAFPFVPLDERRSLIKPRTAGLTMVKDYQMGLRGLEDLLDVAADYIDIFKFVTGTVRLFDREQVIRKTALLRRHQVRPFLGGQFQEYVLHTMGLDAFPRHLREARDLGFEIVEISDNVVKLPDGVRKQLLDQVRDLGMSAVGEIGDKHETTWAKTIVEDVKLALSEGSEFAMIEGQELMIDGAPNTELINMLKQEVDVGRCMFEVSTPYVGSTLHEIYAGKKFLIKTFGPDVNLGNITSDAVIETEVTRLGLGAAGPLSYL